MDYIAASYRWEKAADDLYYHENMFGLAQLAMRVSRILRDVPLTPPFPVEG
jgi:hypothetical protein